VLAVAVVGCGTNPLPANRTVSQEGAITSGRGAYAVAVMSNHAVLSGELIASEGRRGVLILGDDDKLRWAAPDALFELRLGVHDNNKGGFIGWTVLGALSTISHGFWLVFSAPAWILIGSVATSHESHRGILDCPPRQETAHPDVACLDVAGRFARFPQGPPPGVGEAQLLGRAPVAAPPPAPAPAPPPALAPAAPEPPAAEPPAAAPPIRPAPPATPAPPAAPAAPGFPAPYEPGK
jgi:hypothetical protein